MGSCLTSRSHHQTALSVWRVPLTRQQRLRDQPLFLRQLGAVSAAAEDDGRVEQEEEEDAG